MKPKSTKLANKTVRILEQGNENPTFKEHTKEAKLARVGVEQTCLELHRDCLNKKLVAEATRNEEVAIYV